MSHIVKGEKLPDPDKLEIVMNGLEFVKITLDGVEIPFACHVLVNNEFVQDGRDRFVQGARSIKLTLRPKSISIRQEPSIKTVTTIGTCYCGNEFEIILPEDRVELIKNIECWLDKNKCPKCGIFKIMSIEVVTKYG